tara:strand:+ start:180 stop:401 length:222 start_codon:yes stop_codon:yes gene_type:complete
MNSEAKKKLIVALFKGIINKGEAKQLIHAKMKFVIDLSSSTLKTNTIEALLTKVPDLRNHFTKLISLGNGKKP